MSYFEQVVHRNIDEGLYVQYYYHLKPLSVLVVYINVIPTSTFDFCHICLGCLIRLPPGDQLYKTLYTSGQTYKCILKYDTTILGNYLLKQF